MRRIGVFDASLRWIALEDAVSDPQGFVQNRLLHGPDVYHAYLKLFHAMDPAKPHDAAALNGLFAALLGLSAAWLSDALGGAVAWLLPVAAFGVPAALWQLVRRKSVASSGQPLAAWALAGLAPFLVTRAWF